MVLHRPRSSIQTTPRPGARSALLTLVKCQVQVQVASNYSSSSLSTCSSPASETCSLYSTSSPSSSSSSSSSSTTTTTTTTERGGRRAGTPLPNKQQSGSQRSSQPIHNADVKSPRAATLWMLGVDEICDDHNDNSSRSNSNFSPHFSVLNGSVGSDVSIVSGKSKSNSNRSSISRFQSSAPKLQCPSTNGTGKALQKRLVYIPSSPPCDSSNAPTPRSLISDSSSTFQCTCEVIVATVKHANRSESTRAGTAGSCHACLNAKQCDFNRRNLFDSERVTSSSISSDDGGKAASKKSKSKGGKGGIQIIERL